jgi:type II secretory pathway pseudopilin PulG
MTRPVHRSAFSFAELLVLIAIAAVLLGLLLPAVMKSREAAARTQCQNNLRQIGMAAFNYESAFQKFPPGINVSPNSRNPNPAWNTPPPWAGPYTGVLAYLLPFIEQQNVYNLVPESYFQLNTTAPAWAYGGGPFDFQDPSVPPSLWSGTGGGYPKATNSKVPRPEAVALRSPPKGGQTRTGRPRWGRCREAVYKASPCPQESRRIGGAFQGRTAKGRGFSTY